jgi:choline-sulfatase
MDDDKPSSPPHADDPHGTSRRRFLQGTVATAGALALPQVGAGPAADTNVDMFLRRRPPKGKRPNFLILICDENRYPPVYESEVTKQYRAAFLRAQNALRAHGVDFQRHYAASVACVPSRASIYARSTR